MNYLLSYPRSGNSWLRYCVEIILHRKTIGEPKFNIIKNNNDVILCKGHSNENVKNNKDEKLILIIRNYKEVIISHNGYNYTIMNDSQEPGLISYLKLLKFYDEFIGKKIIIYYEDIINNLEDQLVKIFSFLEVSVNKEFFKDFLNNIEYHKKNALTFIPRK